MTACVILTISLLGAELALSANQSPAASRLPAPNQVEAAPPRLTLPAEGNVPVAIVLGKDAEVLDFCGPLEVFASTMTPSGKAVFQPYLVAETTEPVRVSAGMTVIPRYSFKTAPTPKVIVIPAMNPEAVTVEMLDWIRRSSKEADVTMSVCNGVFTLAKTGLLDGRKATSHHSGYFRLAATFPKLHLIRGARYVEDGKFACAGGVSSGIDLALRVVERYQGRKGAQEVADFIEYQGKGWLDPRSASPYATITVSSNDYPRCPLCGMECDKTLTYVYKGKTYFFCCESDKKLFIENLNLVDRFAEEVLPTNH